MPMAWKKTTDTNRSFSGYSFGFKASFKISVKPTTVEKPRPCEPNPCGLNAQCKEQNGAINCVCPSDYIGDPYSSCRPECLINTDCPRDKSCSKNRCIDPCPGTCGANADCRATNHIAMCTCKESFSGDPYSSCGPIPVIRMSQIIFQPESLVSKNYDILSS